MSLLLIAHGSGVRVARAQQRGELLGPGDVRADALRTLEATWGAFLGPQLPYGWFVGSWSVEIGGERFAGAAARATEDGLLLLGDASGACRVGRFSSSSEESVCETRVDCEAEPAVRSGFVAARSPSPCPSLDARIRWSAPLQRATAGAGSGQWETSPGWLVILDLRRGRPTTAIALETFARDDRGDDPDAAILAAFRRATERTDYRVMRVDRRHGELRLVVEREVTALSWGPPTSDSLLWRWRQRRVVYEMQWRIGASIAPSSVSSPRITSRMDETCSSAPTRRPLPDWGLAGCAPTRESRGPRSRGSM